MINWNERRRVERLSPVYLDGYTFQERLKIAQKEWAKRLQYLTDPIDNARKITEKDLQLRMTV